MFEYIVMALLPLGLAFFYHDIDIDNKQKRNYLVFVGLFLFLFLALRNKSIGSTDTLNYYNMMHRAIIADTWAEYYNEDYVEAGFQFFTFCLSRIFKDPQWIIVISSFIYVISTCYFIYHNSDDAPLSMVMYITLGLMIFEMQGMRQSIAMSICLFAYECAKKKKLIHFVFVVLVATQFHRTAIVFFVVYFLIKLKYNLMNLFWVIVLGVVGISLSEKIIDIANDVFEKNYTKAVDSGGFIATAIYILILLFAFLFNKSLQQNGKSTQMLYMLFIATFCYIMRYFGAVAAERISYYFMYSQIVLLPNTIMCMEEHEGNIVRGAIIVLAVGLFIYRINGTNLIPYEFYFNT